MNDDSPGADMVRVSRQTTPTTPARVFVDIQTQFKPFSWIQSVDWKLTTERMSLHQQLIKWILPPETNLKAIFSERLAMQALRDNSSSMILCKSNMTSILNSIGQSGGPTIESAYTWLKSLPLEVVTEFSRALPGPILDVFKERTFAAALQAGDIRTVTAMLHLKVDPLEPIHSSQPNYEGRVAPIIYTRQLGLFEVAKLLVTHACQHGTAGQRDETLDQIVRFGPQMSSAKQLQIFELVELACISLSAGAAPTKACLELSNDNFDLTKKLLESSKNDISLWLRIGLLTLPYNDYHHQKRKLCHEAILLYVLRERRHQLSISEPDTKIALLDALSLSIQEERMLAIETILGALHDLGFQLSPDSKTGADIPASFEKACHGKKWDIASSLTVMQMSSLDDEAWGPGMRSDDRFPEFADIQAMVMETIEQEDVARIVHLYQSLNGGSDRNNPRIPLLELVARCASDEMVMALTPRTEDSEFLKYCHMKHLLIHGRVKVVSKLLRTIPNVETAMIAARELEDFGLLDDVLHRYFPVSLSDSQFEIGGPSPVDYQLNLRTFAYYAFETKDTSLFVWLLTCDMNFEEVIIGNNEGDIYLTKGPIMQVNTGIVRHHNDMVLPSLLGIAAARNETSWMEFLFIHGAEGRDSMTLLYAVNHKANDVAVRTLLDVARSQRRCNRSVYGSAALRTAVSRRDMDMIDMLWEVVDVDGIESSTQDILEERICLSPLGEAILMGDLDIVNVLLSKGANPNALVTYDRLEGKENYRMERASPLLAAIHVGNLSIVEALIRAGAMVDYKQRFGLVRTPLQRAAENGKFDIVKYLIEQGAVIDTVPASRGGTALQLAAMNGYVGIATLLLEHGANPNYPPPVSDGSHGRTAFELAAEWSRIDMMLLLMRWGVQLDLEFGDPAESQYERAQRRAAKNGYPAAKRFVQYLYTLTPERLSRDDALALNLLPDSSYEMSPSTSMPSPW
jgi:ankyrin repeat protein